MKITDEQLTTSLVNMLESDNSKKFCAMNLIQLMQDNDISFEVMLLFLAGAKRRVKDLIKHTK